MGLKKKKKDDKGLDGSITNDNYEENMINCQKIS